MVRSRLFWCYVAHSPTDWPACQSVGCLGSVMTTMSYRAGITISMIIAFTICGIMIFAALSH
jgi:hypothetical protein